jgi:hypothetical protein
VCRLSRSSHAIFSCTKWLLATDLRYGWRLLRRSPAFTGVAVMSIAIGIGTNSSVFTLLDRVMLRSLLVPHPEQLVVLTSAGFQYGGADGDGDELSYPMYEDLRDANQAFTSMFARVGTVLDVTAAGATDRPNAELVSGTYFSTLGISVFSDARAERRMEPEHRPLSALVHERRILVPADVLIGRPPPAYTAPGTIVA